MKVQKHKKVQRYFDTESEAQDKVEVYDVSNKKPKHNRRHEFKKGPKNAPKNVKNGKVVHVPNPKPKFKGKPKIPKEVLEKYATGEGVNVKTVKARFHQKRLKTKEKKIQYATELAARTEVLLTQDAGYLEADAGETTTQYRQEDILENVDITAASKHFDLRLTDFGPYRAKFSRNGRQLLLGGRRGHVAAFDWITKRLHCEINVMESVYDVCWMHIETMFAVAQKDWVYMYDNQGLELHCVKRLNRVMRMEFLPYHFLLATCSDEGYLGWLDISIGKLVNQFNTKLGKLTMMTQNPYNATLCIGHAKGVVSMWSPNTRDPLAKMLCHKAPMSALHIDPRGVYMATAAVNREVKIWDIRKLAGPLQEYKPIVAATNIALSQKNMLALGMGNVVEVYRECCTQTAKRAYLRHRFVRNVCNFQFCPYEDVLGVATETGFTSLLVPGAGEANFDAREVNPYQSTQQRKEMEVKALLEKIQPELITLNPFAVGEVETQSLLEKLEQKKQLLHVKPPKIDFTPRNKAKGKGGAVKMAKNKKIVQELAKREFLKNVHKPNDNEKKPEDSNKAKHILDRFRSKKT